jgi:DNA-binding MarR family transcriptional regulator
MGDYLVEALQAKGITGLILSHGAVLMQLQDQAGMSPQTLAKNIGKSPQTMTTLVRKLETLGYVTVAQSKEDKRTKIVNITELGLSIVAFIKEYSNKMYQIQISNFTEEEYSQLRYLLQKLLLNFENKGA